MKKISFLFALLFSALLFAGTASALTTITDCAGLQAMNINLDEYYVLGKNIDCDVFPFNTGTGFTPIGKLSDKFTGSLNGQGFKITGLYIDTTTVSDGIGLFGNLRRATIKNVVLENVSITGNSTLGPTGGLAGASSRSVIINSNVTGTVKANKRVGGLIGNSMLDTIIDSSFNGVAKSTSYAGWVGGIIGTANSTKICRSFSSGTVNGPAFTGGLVGSALNTLIDCSFSTANITTNSLIGQSFAGGLIGTDQSSTIQNSFARGSVGAGVGTGSSWVGGLIGNAEATTLTNSFATGQLSGLRLNCLIGCVYGLARFGNLPGSNCNNCFWDTDSSGVSTSDCGTGKTTPEMKQQSTFTGWDFTSTWGIDISKNDSYPYQKCMENPVSLNNAPESTITSPLSNPLSILERESITFQGQGQDDDSCDAIQANEWACETINGICPASFPSIRQNPGLIVFNDRGSYTIKYRVQDSTGTWDPTPDTRVITVNSAVDNPPVAVAGVDQSVPSGLLVSLDGSGSFDPEDCPVGDSSGTCLTYSWACNASSPDPCPVLNDSSNFQPTFTSGSAGEIYIFQLIVDDGVASSAADFVTVTVVALPNVAPVAEANGNYSGASGAVVNLLGGCSDSDGFIAAGGCGWMSDYSDDCTITSADTSDGSGASETNNGSIVCNFAVSTDVTVSLTATDNVGAIDSDTATVTVTVTPSTPWDFHIASFDILPNSVFVESGFSEVVEATVTVSNWGVSDFATVELDVINPEGVSKITKSTLPKAVGSSPVVFGPTPPDNLFFNVNSDWEPGRYALYARVYDASGVLHDSSSVKYLTVALVKPAPVPDFNILILPLLLAFVVFILRKK